MAILMLIMADLEGLEPWLLLDWLEHAPDDLVFHNLDDLLYEYLRLPNYELESPSDTLDRAKLYCSVDGDQVVVGDQDNDVELFRATPPEWVLSLDGLIEFWKSARQESPTKAELLELLSFIWLS